MRRFVIQFIIIIFCSNSFAEEAKKVMVIPVDKISDKKNYSSKELQAIFNNYLESFDGKSVWPYSATKAKTGSLTGVALPASFENSSSGNLDLNCYRCGLGKSELVNQSDCEKIGLKWNIQNMTELKKTCN
jgi:hypothetical protein